MLYTHELLHVYHTAKFCSLFPPLFEVRKRNETSKKRRPLVVQRRETHVAGATSTLLTQSVCVFVHIVYEKTYGRSSAYSVRAYRVEAFLLPSKLRKSVVKFKKNRAKEK